MQTISISELQRNLHKIDHLDIAEIVDKKRNQVKGYFLDKKYVSVIHEIMDAEENRRQKRLEEFRQLTRNRPMITIDKDIDICKLDEDMNDALL